MRILYSAVATATAAAFAATAVGQLPQQQIHAAGVGAQMFVCDVQTLSSNAACLGVVYLAGEYFVSGRDAGSGHKVYCFDEAGAMVREFDQPAATASSAWGFRDGATDGASLMFGYEDGIYVLDPHGAMVSSVIARNGPQPITQPIVAASGVTTHRGVAYDPAGNSGNGSIWLGNFGADIVEIALDGTVLRTLPNNSEWSVYGLVWDPWTRTLLANSVPNAGEIAQIDPVTGTTTGHAFGRNQPGTAQGGLSAVPHANGWDVVGLDQGTPDSITRYRVHLYTQPLRNGFDENRLLTGTNFTPLDGEPIKTMVPGGTVQWQLPLNGDFHLPNTPAWFILNLGSEALVNGTPMRGVQIPELVALTRFSDPLGNPIIAMGRGGQTLQIPTPSGILKDGDYLRLQAISVNPLGLAAVTASNQMFFVLDGARILVEAVGSNSFNSDPSSGFFRIHHRLGSPIDWVEFDWASSSNPAQATMRFDTNQTGMADLFDAGNSTTSGCLGTYRNGSDAATGLIYDGTTTAPTSSCAVSAGANTGWIGTNPGSSGDYKTLRFRFAPGMFSGRLFEFDADTDGGAGINGSSMEGMVVTIGLADGTVLSGELAADPANSLRSFLRFVN